MNNPDRMGRCAQCGEEILSGEEIFRFEETMIHLECMGDYLSREFSAEETAALFGFERETA